MPNPGTSRWETSGRLDRVEGLLRDGHSWRQIAATLCAETGERISQEAVRLAVKNRRPHLHSSAVRVAAPVIDAPPSPMLPVKDLVRQRVERWKQRKKHEDARALVKVRMPELAPIGILVHGDPHIDDEGTDLPLLLRHAELVASTPGLYAASVGDQQNNWVGRLARLYAEQSTTAREAWALSEHWISMHGPKKWLFIVLGNHDLWAGPNDPMQWICLQQGVDLLQEWEVRLALQFPGGPEVRVRCAHDFPGSSQWNDAHAPGKALRMGTRDHIALCGHRHHFGYQPVPDPEGGLMHACRVGSYKLYDQHARQLGHTGVVYPCILLTIDPRQPESAPDRIKWFLDAEVGADYLTFLRSRKGT